MRYYHSLMLFNRDSVKLEKVHAYSTFLSASEVTIFG